MVFGLKNLSTFNWIRFQTKEAEIINENKESFKLEQILALNNNDVFGCGLVYPPTTKLDEEEEFPYMFFTLNGKQIGKGVLLEDNFYSYKPRVYLNCCSIETNFGDDLESKPFKYDITKHSVHKEMY
ncbi:unnamed protein product [Meloidogyne enterolobii]|uniref:Uncharacterized protein n=1 Tax=Meloidogyne enterolobii TaxID=390850 RepID=A0ACB0YMA0_MELEN